MKDWVKEWYNDQFENIDLTPSSDVWENISQRMEDWPKHWYASNVSDLGTKPRPSTWDKLQESLAHERRVRLANRISYLAASFVLFFLLTIPFNLEDSYTEIPNNHFADSLIDEYEDGSSDRSNKRNEKFDNRLAQQKEKVSFMRGNESKSSQEEKRETNTFPVSGGLEQIELTFSTQRLGDLIASKESLRIRSLPVLNSRVSGEKPNSDLIIDSGKPQRGNWISLALVPQLSSLDNPLSRKVINSSDESLVWNPSMTYALSAGHKFDNRNGVKIAMLFNNKKTLQTESNSGDRNIELNYFSLGALYTSTWQIGQSERLSLNTEAGLFAGVLTNKDVLFNNERVKYLEEGYEKLDAGVVLGASISTRLSEHWSLNTGLNSQVGILNTFQGTEAIPSDYFRTTTQSIGLNVGVVYNL